MKFSIDAKPFLNTLRKAVKATADRSTLPMLKTVLLTVTEDDTLEVTTTDLETRFRAVLALSGILDAGSVALHASDLIKMVSESGTINIQVVNDKAKIKTNKVDYTLQGFDASHFPTIPNLLHENLIDIDVDTLKQMITATHNLVNPNLTTPMGSLHIKAKNKCLRLAATNGNIMSFIQTKIEDDVDIDFLCPKNALTLINNLLDDDEGDTTICFDKSNSQLELQIGAYNVIAVGYQGKYPDLSRILNAKKTYTTKTKVTTRDMSEILSKADSLMGKMEAVELSFMNNLLVVNGKGYGRSSFFAEIEAEVTGETDYTLKVCPRDFGKCIGTFTTEEIELHTSEKCHGGIIVNPVNQQMPQQGTVAVRY